MNSGFLLAIARLPELRSTHSAIGGDIQRKPESSDRSLGWSTGAINIVGPDDVSSRWNSSQNWSNSLLMCRMQRSGQAGFPVSDVILAIDGEPVRAIRDMIWHLGQISPGRSRSSMIICFQQESTIKIQLK